MKQKYSPMMMQYLGIKEQNKDAIVMFRLGDFYEMCIVLFSKVAWIHRGKY